MTPDLARAECAICGHPAPGASQTCATCSALIATAEPPWTSFYVRYRDGDPQVFDATTGVLHVLPEQQRRARRRRR
jgi:hypothetical protein